MGHWEEAIPTWGEDSNDNTSDDVLQGHIDTCAIKAQQLILKDYGIDATEDELVDLARVNGWYDGGTPQEAMGKILEYYDIEVTRSLDGNAYTLTNEISQGHRVMVAVDSSELWDKGLFGDIFNTLEDFLFQRADHALLVAGVDTSDADDIRVHLKDPGTGEIAANYSMEDFLDAWKDSNCLMVSTNEPVPPYTDGMENFNYGSNRCAEFFGNVSFEDFQEALQRYDDIDNGVSFGNFHDDLMAYIRGDVDADVFESYGDSDSIDGNTEEINIDDINDDDIDSDEMFDAVQDMLFDNMSCNEDSDGFEENFDNELDEEFTLDDDGDINEGILEEIDLDDIEWGDSDE